ncbi:hypothetical protein C8J57DRAFT_1512975 [Mycena rebaudengoi]|nr:hypothetical protein C8J57DRAFT_1512975 [Mycena rebaudengoi]
MAPEIVDMKLSTRRSGYVPIKIGESRRIVKDFTMLDFLYMISKLESPRLRTYFDNTGIDLFAHSTFPGDGKIAEITLDVAEESDSLIALLGLSLSQLNSASAPINPILPRISSWFNDANSESNYADSDDIPISRPHAQSGELLNLTCAALALSAEEMMKM